LKPPEPVQTSLADVFESKAALRQIFDSLAGADLVGQIQSDFGRYIGLGGTP
jgi:hypothetical protein